MIEIVEVLGPTDEEFRDRLRESKGNLKLLFEKRENHSAILCFCSIYAPLWGEIEGNSVSIADFKHKGTAFVVKYYYSDAKDSDIAKDFAHYESLLSNYKKKNRGEND